MIIYNFSVITEGSDIKLIWDNFSVVQARILKADSSDLLTILPNPVDYREIDGIIYEVIDTVIVTATTMEYLDTDVLPNIAYYYRILPYDGVSVEGDPSKEETGKVDTIAPTPIVGLNIYKLSDSSIILDWRDYDENAEGDISGYKIYYDIVDFNVITTQPVVSMIERTNKQVRIAEFTEPENEEDHYFAVTAFDLSGNEDLSVFTASHYIPPPGQGSIGANAQGIVRAMPISTFRGMQITVSLTGGVPNHDYPVYSGIVRLTSLLSTNGSGDGFITEAVPTSLLDGRVSVYVDDGEGNFSINNDSFLVPQRLSHDCPGDEVTVVPDVDIQSGYDGFHIFNIAFITTSQTSDTVTFTFQPNHSPQDLQLNIETLFLEMGEAGVFDVLGCASEAVYNLPINIIGLLTFTYPIFKQNPVKGSLNLFGLVLETPFITAKDWAEDINQYHVDEGGVGQVVYTIAEWNPVTQTYNRSLLDLNGQYVDDFPLTPGKSYFIEVREDVIDYFIEGCGYTEMKYFDFVYKAGSPSITFAVITTDAGYTMASQWANAINAQHVANGGVNRVVCSIIRWDETEQLFDKKLIDVGTHYTNDFALEDGRGYVIEVRQTVSDFLLTGTPISN